MVVYEPAYYRDFHCLAAECPDSCCQQWDIQVDADSAARYRALPGPLGDLLRRVLIDRDGETVMQQVGGRCPMWRQDGLCMIQAQLGEEALCQVCTDFPRLRHDYGDFVELGLELSCPEAARLIFSASPSPFIARTTKENREAEYDPALMHTLRRTREEVFSLLGRQDLSIRQILAILLLYGYAVQEEIDGGAPALLDVAADLAQANSLAKAGDFGLILAFFSSLEILTEAWKQRLASPAATPNWSDALRDLARYAVQRYWLQAVSDYDIVCRVKFIITACIIVAHLGGDVVQTAQLYSKEIENDADNVDAILDNAYTHPALTDLNLLGLLCC